VWYVVKHRDNFTFNLTYSCLKGRGHFWDLDVDGSIILTRILQS
jgi:hypothetical protein